MGSGASNDKGVEPKKSHKKAKPDKHNAKLQTPATHDKNQDAEGYTEADIIDTGGENARKQKSKVSSKKAKHDKHNAATPSTQHDFNQEEGRDTRADISDAEADNVREKNAIPKISNGSKAKVKFKEVINNTTTFLVENPEHNCTHKEDKDETLDRDRTPNGTDATELTDEIPAQSKILNKQNVAESKSNVKTPEPGSVSNKMDYAELMDGTDMRDQGADSKIRGDAESKDENVDTLQIKSNSDSIPAQSTTPDQREKTTTSENKDIFWSANDPVAPRFDSGKTKPLDSTETRRSPKGNSQTNVTKPTVQSQPDPRFSKNIDFYQNKIRSKPSPGCFIEDMLKWRGDYRQLEINHRYIQWLFPIPESGGMNPEAQPLHPQEIEAMRKSHPCRNRFMKAYEMMLDFYGMRLVTKATGDIARSDNWKTRFAHLNRSGHNYLRISRILKALSCFGLTNYQKPWVDFFLQEVFVTRVLSEIRHGAVYHWIDIMDDTDAKQECLLLCQDLHYNSKASPQQILKITAEENDSDSDDDNDAPNQTLDADLKPDENHDEVQSHTQSINEKARAKRRQEQNQNVDFYRNKLKSKPEPGYTIEEMLTWKGKYVKWEERCFFIQWLFPIPDTTGVNEHAQALQPHEIKVIRSDNNIKERFLKAYTMMLDFYGMKMKKKTGEISRTSIWKKRYNFLSSSVEDHRRITRIIKSLECFGYPKFQFPWVSFLINEIFFQKWLNIPIESVHMWISMMADDNEKVACATTLEELVNAEEEGGVWRDLDSTEPTHKHQFKQNEDPENASNQHDAKLGNDQKLMQDPVSRKKNKLAVFSDQKQAPNAGVSDNVKLQHMPEKVKKTLTGF